MCSIKKRNHVRFPKVLLVIMFWLIKECICAKSCAQSLMTKQYVSSCPQTKTAWDEAAARKNCSAVKQSCTSPDNFVYHCLANSYQNKLIEVCGVRTPITFPVCAEYNEGGNLVQENHFTDCSGYDPPCPNRYPSTDAYKYPDCYIITQEVTTETTKSKTTTTTTATTNINQSTKVVMTTKKLSEQDHTMSLHTDSPMPPFDMYLPYSQLFLSGIVAAGIVIPFMSIVIVVLICSRRNMKPGDDTSETQQEFEEMLRMV
ncbi:uncharacterized protein LOC128185929 isoform X2 [Crassostrea angulata]|uniref:uncharacterized protein LOC128185929 isoform X2 n=1 Tax=Magallana angulata TaxID=2784310 RepID=UPI0022B17596|nr:uncharacterized protein LOC128185929 isoform X2 [Crassostrea angulata]